MHFKNADEFAQVLSARRVARATSVERNAVELPVPVPGESEGTLVSK